ncbi:MAG TPA: 50S ribosomal protein L30 [Thermoanaerobaculia bacterium]
MAEKATDKSRSGAKAAGKIRLRWKMSAICAPKDQKATIRGLGFRRLGETIEREDSPSIRGMWRKVQHLVEIEG